MTIRCNFCCKNPATHFNIDWDAHLCDECADAQDKAVAAAKVSDLPSDWQALIEKEKKR